MLSKRSEREEIEFGKLRIGGFLVVGLETKVAFAFFVLSEVELEIVVGRERVVGSFGHCWIWKKYIGMYGLVKM